MLACEKRIGLDQSSIQKKNLPIIIIAEFTLASYFLHVAPSNKDNDSLRPIDTVRHLLIYVARHHFFIEPSCKAIRLKDSVYLVDTIMIPAPKLVDSPIVGQEAVKLLAL